MSESRVCYRGKAPLRWFHLPSVCWEWFFVRDEATSSEQHHKDTSLTFLLIITGKEGYSCWGTLGLVLGSQKTTRLTKTLDNVGDFFLSLFNGELNFWLPTWMKSDMWFGWDLRRNAFAFGCDPFWFWIWIHFQLWTEPKHWYWQFYCQSSYFWSTNMISQSLKDLMKVQII